MSRYDGMSLTQFLGEMSRRLDGIATILVALITIATAITAPLLGHSIGRLSGWPLVWTAAGSLPVCVLRLAGLFFGVWHSFCHIQYSTHCCVSACVYLPCLKNLEESVMIFSLILLRRPLKLFRRPSSMTASRRPNRYWRCPTMTGVSGCCE